MSFQFQNKLDILKHTTEKGQLKSVSDSAAQHTLGSSYYDRKNNKTYVYVYNGAGATLSNNDIYFVVPRQTAATGGNYSVEAIATATDHVYVCVPAAAILSLYYGWVQVQGDAEVNASDTTVFLKEVWGAGDELCISDGLSSTLAEGDLGVGDGAYAIVEDARATSDVDDETIYLIGREIIGMT